MICGHALAEMSIRDAVAAVLARGGSIRRCERMSEGGRAELRERMGCDLRENNPQNIFDVSPYIDFEVSPFFCKFLQFLGREIVKK